MKPYNHPMLQIVRINQNNVIATSVEQINTNVSLFYGYGSTEAARTPGRGYYDWDAGY